MLLNLVQAAAKRGTTKFSIRRWLSAGLRHKRYGRSILIDERDLTRFVPRAVGNTNFGGRPRKR